MKTCRHINIQPYGINNESSVICLLCFPTGNILNNIPFDQTFASISPYSVKFVWPSVRLMGLKSDRL